MERKGQESLSTIALGEVIFGIVICVSLLLFVNTSYEYGYNFRETYLEKETASLLNTIESANGDIYVSFSVGKYDYDLELKEGIKADAEDDTLLYSMLGSERALEVNKDGDDIRVYLEGDPNGVEIDNG